MYLGSDIMLLYMRAFFSEARLDCLINFSVHTMLCHGKWYSALIPALFFLFAERVELGIVALAKSWFFGDHVIMDMLLTTVCFMPIICVFSFFEVDPYLIIIYDFDAAKDA